MQKIQNYSTVPNGDFRVNHPITWQEFRHQNISVLFHNYRKYCRDNGFDVISPKEIEQLMCAQHPEWCVDSVTKFPTPMQQAKNLIKEVGNWVVSGMPMALQEMITSRLTTCSTCEWYTGTRCSKCGCAMQVKVHLKTAKCPMGLWKE